MDYNPNRIIGYKELHNQRQEKQENNSKITTYIVIGTAVLGIYFGSKMLEKPVKYSGTKSYTFEQYQGLNDATMAVNRDPKQVSYPEVTEYIKDMPENAKVLSDGVQAGDTITIPDTVYKQ